MIQGGEGLPKEHMELLHIQIWCLWGPEMQRKVQSSPLQGGDGSKARSLHKSQTLLIPNATARVTPAPKATVSALCHALHL